MASYDMEAGPSSSSQSSTPEDVSGPSNTEDAVAQLKTRLDGLHTLLFIREEHHAAFEALATMLLLEMITKGTPSIYQLSGLFLRLYGAVLWPLLTSQRKHLVKPAGDERHQLYWRGNNGSFLASPEGPIFAVHTAGAYMNGVQQTTQQPTRHHNRLMELMWRYFELLIQMGRYGELDGRFLKLEFILLATITKNASLAGFLETEDDDDEQEVGSKKGRGEISSVQSAVQRTGIFAWSCMTRRDDAACGFLDAGE